MRKLFKVLPLIVLMGTMFIADFVIWKHIFDLSLTPKDYKFIYDMSIVISFILGAISMHIAERFGK